AAGNGDGDLANMGLVMNDPCCKKLAKGHLAELRMDSRKAEVLFGEIPRNNLVEARTSNGLEVGQQIRECFVAWSFKLAKAIERWKVAVVSLSKDHLCARDPVGLVTVDQMAHDVIWGPIVAVAGGCREPIRKMREPRRKRSRRGTKQFQ